MASLGDNAHKAYCYASSPIRGSKGLSGRAYLAAAYRHTLPIPTLPES